MNVQWNPLVREQTYLCLEGTRAGVQAFILFSRDLKECSSTQVQETQSLGEVTSKESLDHQEDKDIQVMTYRLNKNRMSVLWKIHPGFTYEMQAG